MIRIAVAGAGHWGPNLIASFYQGRESDVAWVVDPDRTRLAEVKERFPDLETTCEFGDALGDAKVDAFVIATPTSTHFELAKSALESGRHVLVEKPLASSVAEARALVELAESVGRILMVGHVFLYNSAAQQAKRHLSDGDLGRVYYMSMVRTNLGPIRVDANAAWDLASHDISLAGYWLEAEPQTVSAVGGAWINAGIEDVVFATLRYPGGVLVNLHASWLHPRKVRDITIVGDKRMLTFDDVDLAEPLRLYDKQVMDERSRAPLTDSFASFRMSVRNGTVTAPRFPIGEPLRTECQHFIECVKTGREPLTGGREGLSVIRSLEALSASMREGGREIEVEAE